MAKQDLKKRNWACIVYPESAPADWVHQLELTGLPSTISPLHDKDEQTETEEALKKPHWHVILCYNGPTSFNVVKSLTDRFNAPMPIPLETVKGAYRYFTHLDHPDKYQYSKDDIKHLNGFAIGDYAELTFTELEKIRRDLVALIVGNDISEYSDLIELLYDSGQLDMLSVAMRNTIFYNGYISSRRNRAKTALAR
jgi:hypothetical protein